MNILGPSGIGSTQVDVSGDGASVPVGVPVVFISGVPNIPRLDGRTLGAVRVGGANILRILGDNGPRLPGAVGCSIDRVAIISPLGPVVYDIGARLKSRITSAVASAGV